MSPAIAPAVVVVTLDSLRLDVAREALPEVPWEERIAWGTWTLPSHLMLAAGLLPYPTRHDGLALDHYRDAFAAWSRRFGAPIPRDPELWLPTTLRRMGIASGTVVSLPCLALGTPYARGWAFHRLVDLDATDAALSTVIDVTRKRGGPWFWIVNLGATHYPYGLDLPRLSGLHGDTRATERPFGPYDYARMWQAQGERAQEVWGSLEVFRRLLPSGSTLLVTADHGELLGEEGRFGHGPFDHAALRRVPYVEMTL